MFVWTEFVVCPRLSATYKRLQNYHRKCMRQLNYVTKRDRITATQLTSNLGLPPFSDIVDTALLRWTGNIVRMSSERLPRQMMRGAATWVAAFQKGRRCLEDEDLNLQPSTQAGHSKCRQAKRSQKLGLLMNPVESLSRSLLSWLCKDTFNSAVQSSLTTKHVA